MTPLIPQRRFKENSEIDDQLTSNFLRNSQDYNILIFLQQQPDTMTK